MQSINGASLRVLDSSIERIAFGDGLTKIQLYAGKVLKGMAHLGVKLVEHFR